jgi:hypothetical protein
MPPLATPAAPAIVIRPPLHTYADFASLPVIFSMDFFSSASDLCSLTHRQVSVKVFAEPDPGQAWLREKFGIAVVTGFGST